MKNIKNRLIETELLRVFEIRYFALSRKMMEVIFNGLSKNKSIQKLILTHDSLQFATKNEFQLFGDMLKVNKHLKIIDVSKHIKLNDSKLFHEQIIKGLS